MLQHKRLGLRHGKRAVQISEAALPPGTSWCRLTGSRKEGAGWRLLWGALRWISDLQKQTMGRIRGEPKLKFFCKHVVCMFIFWGENPWL